MSLSQRYRFIIGGRVLCVMLLLLILVLITSAPVLYAAPSKQIPNTLNYQGTLRNDQGNLVNGDRSITFRIYDALIDGTSVYTETVAVPVRDGIFNAVLGDNDTGIPSNAFVNQARYIGITVAPDPNEMVPRQRLHPVPWAQLATNALTANSATNSTNATTAATATTLIPNAKVDGGLTVNGGLTFDPGLGGWRVYVDGSGILRLEERTGGFLRLGLNPNGNVLVPGDFSTRSVSLDSGTKINGDGADVKGKVIATLGFTGHCVTGGFNQGVVGNNLNVACNSDVAETFGTDERTEPGDLVIFIPEDRAFPAVQLSTQPYEGAIVGVVSTDPGLVFDQGETRLAGDNANLITDNKTVVAMVGRVPTKFSLENGPIAVGDPLTSSSTPGAAMKATRAGQIIGYAMQSSDAADDGKLLVWLQLGTYIPDEQLAAINGATLVEHGDATPAIGALEAQVAALTAQIEEMEANTRPAQWPWGLSLFGGLMVIGLVVSSRSRFLGGL